MSFGIVDCHAFVDNFSEIRNHSLSLKVTHRKDKGKVRSIFLSHISFDFKYRLRVTAAQILKKNTANIKRRAVNSLTDNYSTKNIVTSNIVQKTARDNCEVCKSSMDELFDSFSHLTTILFC